MKLTLYARRKKSNKKKKQDNYASLLFKGTPLDKKGHPTKGRAREPEAKLPSAERRTSPARRCDLGSAALVLGGLGVCVGRGPLEGKAKRNPSVSNLVRPSIWTHDCSNERANCKDSRRKQGNLNLMVELVLPPWRERGDLPGSMLVAICKLCKTHSMLSPEGLSRKRTQRLNGTCKLSHIQGGRSGTKPPNLMTNMLTLFGGLFTCGFRTGASSLAGCQ